MSYAIIETGGKQIRVEPGRFYDIELLHVEPDEKVTIDKVLLVNHDDNIHVGQPWVEGATVEGRVMRHFRGRKVIVYKMRPKKKTRKKRGHRQEITRFMIETIALNGSIVAQSSEESEQKETPVSVVETPAVEAEVVEESTAEVEPETLEEATADSEAE